MTETGVHTHLLANGNVSIRSEGGQASTGTLTLPSLVGGGTIVASGLGSASVDVTSVGYTDTLKRHFALSGCSDIRLGYSGIGTSGSSEVPIANPVLIRAGVGLTPTGTPVPVTFGGKQTGQLEPGGFLLSDPIAIDPDTGTSFYSRTRQESPLGPSIAFSTGISAADTSFQTATLPNPALLSASGSAVVQLSGTTIDQVTIVSITGTGPYTWTLKSGTTIAHSHTTSNTVYQQTYSNAFAYLDYGEAGLQNSATDFSYSGTFSSPGQNVRTISTTVLAGVQEILINNYIYAPSLILNTGGGSQEQVTPVTVYFDGTNYHLMLAAPTINGHNSTETVTPNLANAYFAAGFSPSVITADRVRATSARQKTVIVCGDSITQGTGYTARGLSSWATLAFEGKRPYVNTALGGESGATFATLAGSALRRSWFSVGDWLLYAYGANDLGLTGAQIWANTQIVLNLAKNRGLRTAVCTVTPRTTGTFLTAAGQSTGVNEQHRLDYNGLVRAAAGGSQVDLVVDLADFVEVNASNVRTRNGGRWYSDGGTVAYTMEGLHPTVLGHNLIASQVPFGSFV